MELELTLLQRDTPQKYLSVITEAMQSRRNIRKIQKALFGLRSYMEVGGYCVGLCAAYGAFSVMLHDGTYR